MGIVEKSVVSYAHRFYKARLMLLKELGYDDYNQYLQSNVWRQIRETILSRDKFRCRLCGAQATEVHHRKYTKAVLVGAVADDSLISLCRKCHQSIEFDENGNKVNPIKTEQKLSKELAYIHKSGNVDVQCGTKRKKQKHKHAKRTCVICEIFNVHGNGEICSTCIPMSGSSWVIRQRLEKRSSGIGKNKEWLIPRISQAEHRMSQINAAIRTVVESWNKS